MKIETAGNRLGIPVTTQFQINFLGQKTGVNDPNMGMSTFLYDMNGNILSSLDANLNKTTYEYDQLNRLRKETTKPSDDVAPWDEGYAKGQLVKTKVTSGGVLINEKYYKYHLIQRPIIIKHTIDGIDATMEYNTYNAAGQVKMLKYPDNEQVYYDMDMSTGMENVVRNQSWYQYAYNLVYAAPFGKVNAMTYGNGVLTTYRYNDHGEDTVPDSLWDYRLKRIEFNKLDGFNHWQEYVYDDVGNITNIIDKSASFNQSFQYDFLHRMTFASGIYNATGYVYQYDDIGNLIAKEGQLQQYSDPNHKHAVSYVNGLGFAYIYDLNGNMIFRYGATPYQDRKYFYDDNNMITRVTDGNDHEKFRTAYDCEEIVKLVEGGTTTYYFFPQYKKTIHGGTTTEYNYYFSNGNRIAERQKQGTNNNLYFYHKDHLGATIRITDANGVPNNSTYYKPFGEALIQTGSTFTFDHLYNDKEENDSGDLYYYGARYFDPEKGIIK